MNLDTSNAPAVLASNITDVRGTLEDLDKGLASVLLLVELDNVRSPHRLSEGSVQDRDNAREPGCDVGDKRELELGVAQQPTEVGGCLALMDVVGDRVRADSAFEVLGRLMLVKVTDSKLTILGTVLGRPSESFSPDLVPAPE